MTLFSNFTLNKFCAFLNVIILLRSSFDCDDASVFSMDFQNTAMLYGLKGPSNSTFFIMH